MANLKSRVRHRMGAALVYQKHHGLEPPSHREGLKMGERKQAWDVPRVWQVLGVAGLVVAIALWLYAILTPGRQDSAVSVGSALFSSGVVLLVGAHLLSVLRQR